jgi:glycosidase
MSSTSAPVATVSTKVSTWARYPTLYEINTWVWLSALTRKYKRDINLSSVPPAEWDSIANYGFDGVWLMGVWERSPAGIAIANQNSGLINDFRRALPDFRPDDNVGSPYCIRDYKVDRHLGGPDGLATARRELSKRNLNLILDFVPNHVAPDHPWVTEHPEYFIRGTPDDVKQNPSAYVEIGKNVYARGRDPFFPAWPDVLQLNAFAPGLRQAVTATISTIAEQCDGIRCDMAMLMMNDIFSRTWGDRAGQQPKTEYWTDVISHVKKNHPGFLFIAEAYWDLEWHLQQLGFDFCYDKKLYDRFEHSNAESVRLHLCADLAYQNRLLRFIENHDEPRAASTFSPAKERAVAVSLATLPGLRLYHEGQFAGSKIRTPVFLDRHPEEPVDQELQSFYTNLLKVADRSVFREGRWSLCNRTGWSDNQSCQNIVAWNWLQDDERYLIVINFSDSPAQALIHLPWPDLGRKLWHLVDLLSDSIYDRDGDEIISGGLYVALEPWNYNLFRFMQMDRT